MKKLLLFIGILISLTTQAQTVHLNTSNDFMNDDDNTPASVLATSETSNYRMVNVNYNNLMKATGVSASIVWAGNITGGKLPLYIESGVKVMYAKPEIQYLVENEAVTESWIPNFFRYNYNVEKKYCIMALGVPVHVTYKFLYKDFRLMPIFGPSIYAYAIDWDKIYFGMGVDFGARVGYKGTFIEYTHTFNAKRMGNYNSIGLSFAF